MNELDRARATFLATLERIAARHYELALHPMFVAHWLWKRFLSGGVAR